MRDISSSIVPTLLKFGAWGRNQEKELRKVMLGATVYGIWRERNARRNQNSNMSAQMLAFDIIRKMRGYLCKIMSRITDSVQKRIICDYLNISPNWRQPITKQVSWQRPLPGEAMLNTDGSVKNGVASYGGLIRNFAGKTMCCFNANLGNESVLEQELRGVEIGLSTAISLGIKHIAMGSDSSMAVDICSGRKAAPWYLKNLAKAIDLHLRKFTRWRIFHTYREANKAADWLASRTGIGVGTCIFNHPLEPELEQIILDDSLGKVYYRNAYF